MVKLGHMSIRTEALAAVCFKLAEAKAERGRATEGRARVTPRREAARTAEAKTLEAMTRKNGEGGKKEEVAKFSEISARL